MKKMNKKGFTLAELLIVIAIMAILIAVAIPVFSAQLEKARETADAATARSATELAYSEYLLYHSKEGATSGGTGTPVSYYFAMDAKGNLSILGHSTTTDTSCNNAKSTVSESTVNAQSKKAAKVTDGLIVSVAADGSITNNWSNALLDPPSGP